MILSVYLTIQLHPEINCKNWFRGDKSEERLSTCSLKKETLKVTLPSNYFTQKRANHYFVFFEI